MRLFIASFFVTLFLAVGQAQAQLDALNQAAMLGQVDRIAELLDGGLPVDGDGQGYSPLMFAAGYGQVEATRLLLARGASPAYRDHNQDRAMLWAAQKGHAGTVALLLAAGDSADSDLDPYGQSPLFDASFYGFDEVVRLLLAAGADPNRRDQTEDTPLHNAAVTGQAGVVGLLLGAGADPDAVEEIFLRTPVHVAAGHDNVEALGLLVEAGGDVSAREKKGATPLHFAANFGLPGNVALLLAAGADTNARDAESVTPFAAAVAGHGDRPGDFHGAAKLLAERVIDLDEAFAAAVWGGYGDIATRLAERGASAKGRDNLHRPALAGASSNDGMAMFELMLALGADVAADGPAALAAAAGRGRIDIAKRLLGLGVPVDARDEADLTPLHHAAMEGRVEMAALLIDRGADRDPHDAAGNTIEVLMQARRGLIEAEIEHRQGSRAYIPTDELETELATLRQNHEAILALLRG